VPGAVPTALLKALVTPFIMQNENAKGGHFRISLENISFLMKKVDMYFKRAYSSHTWQCYSYGTCENLSKADAKSSRNE